MIVKETLGGRKNTSPANVYEITQLYAAGALKVACVGLQCMGFNRALYRELLEHSKLQSHTVIPVKLPTHRMACALSPSLSMWSPYARPGYPNTASQRLIPPPFQLRPPPIGLGITSDLGKITTSHPGVTMRKPEGLESSGFDT